MRRCSIGAPRFQEMEKLRSSERRVSVWLRVCGRVRRPVAAATLPSETPRVIALREWRATPAHQLVWVYERAAASAVQDERHSTDPNQSTVH